MSRKPTKVPRKRGRLAPRKGTSAAADDACFKFLVEHVGLISVHLVENRASLAHGHLQDAVAAEPHTLDLHLRPIQYRAAIINAEPDRKVLYCGIKFAITEDEKVDDDGDGSSVVDISAEYALFYRVPPEAKCTKHGMYLFAGHNGVFNAWPFFRELAHSLVGRMGLPSVVMPLLRLPPRPRAQL